MITHNASGSTKSQDNVNYAMCSTHNVKSDGNIVNIRVAGEAIVNAIHQFTNISGNKS